MKQSDIFSIVIIALVGALGSYFGVNALLGDPSDESVTFSTMRPISAELKNPDPEVFNVDAINPTVEVYVGTCVDLDQNGILDEEELKICKAADEEGKENDDEESEENNDDERE